MIQIPIMTLMEFCPGCDFYSENFDASVFVKDSPYRRQYLSDIGRILIYDVILNNWDRLPLVWDNEGNLGNFFWCKNENQRIMAIDNTTTAIMLPTAKQKYLEKVQSLVEQILKYNGGDATAFPLLQKMRQYFIDQFDQDMGETGVKFLVEGMVVGIHNVIEGVTRDKLQACVDQYKTEVDTVIASMTHGADKQGKYGLSKVSVDFIMDCVDVYQRSSDAIATKMKEWDLKPTPAPEGSK